MQNIRHIFYNVIDIKVSPPKGELLIFGNFVCLNGLEYLQILKIDFLGIDRKMRKQI